MDLVIIRDIEKGRQNRPFSSMVKFELLKLGTGNSLVINRPFDENNREFGTSA